MFVVACDSSAKDIKSEFERCYDLIVILQNSYPKELGTGIKLLYLFKPTIKSCNEDDKMYTHFVSMRFAVSTTNTYFKKNLFVLVKKLCDVENKRLLLSLLDSFQYIVGLFRKSSKFYWQMMQQALHYSTCCKPDQHTPVEIYSIVFVNILCFIDLLILKQEKCFKCIIKRIPIHPEDL